MQRTTDRKGTTNRIGVGVALVVGLSGCNGCGDRKPHTPFTIESGTATAASTESAAATSASGFVPILSTPAVSGDAFPLASGSVPAPPGRAFVSGLSADADGDGTPDLFAWVETHEKKQNELWFVRGNDRAGHGVTLATPPSDLGDASCKRDLRLKQIGASTVLAEVEAHCAEQKTYRWFGVVRLHNAPDARDPELRLEGRLGPPAPGESIDMAFSADDRDGDKTDDLKLDLTLDGVLEPFVASGKITLPIVLVDRAAGFARDPSEPDAALAKAAATVMIRARSTKNAKDVPGTVSQLLRAATIVCDGLGGPLLSTSAGAVRCDQHFVGDAIFAVGLAGITSGDVAQAIAAQDALRDLKPASDKHVKELDAALAKAAPIVEAAIVWRVSNSPSKTGILSPLTFDADGNLLVASESGVSRIAASDFAETKSEAIAWPRTIAWQSSGTDFALLGAAKRCVPPAVVVKATVSGGPTDALLPTIGAMVPKGARAGSCHDADLALVPLVSDGHGVIAAVGADILSIESSGSGVTARRVTMPDAKSPPSLPGASRAPDGSAASLPLLSGSGQVLVVTAKGAHRWHSDELRDATSCVPRSGGTRVACITKSGAVLAEPR